MISTFYVYMNFASFNLLKIFYNNIREGGDNVKSWKQKI